MARLSVIVPISVLVIFLLLFDTFKSFRSALLIIANIPFSVIGGILALWLTGIYLSWYWYNGIRDRVDDRVVGKATSWQESLSSFISRNQTAVVAAACTAIVASVVAAIVIRRQPAPDPT